MPRSDPIPALQKVLPLDKDGHFFIRKTHLTSSAATVQEGLHDQTRSLGLALCSALTMIFQQKKVQHTSDIYSPCSMVKPRNINRAFQLNTVIKAHSLSNGGEGGTSIQSLPDAKLGRDDAKASLFPPATGVKLIHLTQQDTKNDKKKRRNVDKHKHKDDQDKRLFYHLRDTTGKNEYGVSHANLEQERQRVMYFF